MAFKLREWFKSAMPSWQSSGEGEAVFWSLLRMGDALLLHSKQALYAHFPTKTGPSANAKHGQVRGIVKGRSESNANYAQRLTQYRYPRGQRVKGNPFAVLDQIVEYWATADRKTSVRCYIVTEMGAVQMRGATQIYLPDTPVYSRDVELTDYQYSLAFSWDGKDSETYWSRFLVYITPNPQLPGIAATPNLGDPTLWGGAVGTPGYVIGMVGWTPADTVVMRKLFYDRRQWKPAWTRALWMLVQLSNWTTEAAVSDGSPYWEHWSFQDAGVRRAARSDVYRYICLSPGLNQYPGNPAQWTESFVEPDGITEYSGDPTNWPATITLATGVSYAGNPNKWPTAIQLVDDGDAAR